MTQHEKILKYLDAHGSITTMEAFEHLRITKLPTRISEIIRRGIPIEKVPENSVNADGERQTFTRYKRAV